MYVICMCLYKLAARLKAFSCSCGKCVHIHACTCMCINTDIYTLFFFFFLPYHASQLLTQLAGKFRNYSPKPFNTGCKRVCKVWGWYRDPGAAAPARGCPLDTSQETCGGVESRFSGALLQKSYPLLFFRLCSGGEPHVCCVSVTSLKLFHFVGQYMRPNVMVEKCYTI